MRSKDEILVRLRPRNTIAPGEREAFIRKLVSLLDGRVLEAYIFGSFLSDQFGPMSDLDLILIVQTDLPYPERGRDFLFLQDSGIPVDILIYTPEEFRTLMDEGPEASSFWRGIRATMRRIL